MKRIVSLNIIFSLLLQVVAIANSFVTTKVTIYYFGTEINGLVSSINQFLNYDSLLEGGIGAVVMANLYKPLYEKKMEQVSSIVNSARKFFFQIILFYTGYVAILSICYPLITKTSLSFLTVTSLIWILSISLCAQFFLAISYKILLQSDHKLYICSVIQIVAYVINIALVISSSIYCRNIIVVKALSSLAFLLQPLLYTIIVKRRYTLNVENSKNVGKLKGRWDGFFQNLAFFINNNTDIVLITFFMNLKEVSVYAVYMLVVNGIKSVILSVSAGFQSTIGRAYASNDQEELKRIFKRYFYIIFLLTFWGFGTAIILIRQFVSIYIGNNVDYQYDRLLFPIIIALSQMIICIREPLNILIISANKFKETNRGAALEAIINICLSVTLIIKFGLVGIAIGTLVASIFRLCYFVKYLNNHIINLETPKIIKPLLFFVIYLFGVGLIYLNNGIVNSLTWTSFLLKGMLYAILNIGCILTLFAMFWFSYIRRIKQMIVERVKKTIQNNTK